jgi:hypothetical protein
MQIDQNDWRLLAEIAALEHAGYRFQSCHSSGITEPVWVFTVMIDGVEHSMALSRKKLKEEASLYV